MIIKLIMYLFLTVSGLILFKMGGTQNNIGITLHNVNIQMSMQSIIGIICYACSFLMWLNIIKDNNITYIYPIANGLVTIMTVVGGILILNERLNIGQVLGIICIIIGVIIVNLNH